MSKTKEEILQHHYIHDRGLVNPVLYVHNAMDAWAEQRLKEYKDQRVKQAHNEAIEKAIDLLGRRVGFGYLEENWDSVKAEIQKLKL